MARKLAPLAENYRIQIDENVFNKTYLPYLYTLNRYEIYYGGASSGKSFFITQKLALQMTVNPGRNLIVLRHQEKDCRDSCFPQLIKAFEQLKLIDLWQIRENPSPRMINRVNGNEIVFTGLDDVENVKSVTFKKGNVTDFWVEEATEIEKVTDIRELARRLRGTGPRKRIIISFNPVARTHWLYDFVNKEIKPKDHMVLRTTYKDNKFLNQEDIDELESLQYSDPYAYQVYALGEWGTMGQSVFNTNTIFARLRELERLHAENPPARIQFEFQRDANGLPNKDSFTHFSYEDGETIIYKSPVARHPYVMGFDTAGEGSDFYAAHVFDNVTGEQVAVYHSVKDPDICVLQLYGLGRYYNDALACPEVNFDSYPVKKFQELEYPNIYQRLSPVDNYHRNIEQKLGFRTTSENRQRILSELVEWANTHPTALYDVETLQEMLTFTRQSKKLKGIFWAAETGAHDDLCFVKGTLILTDKGQVPIENINIGDMVLTRDGYRPVEVTTQSIKKVITKLGLTGTPNHPIITTKGVKPLVLVKNSDEIYVWNEENHAIEVKKVWNAKRLFTTGKSITDIQSRVEDNLGNISGDTTNGKNRRFHYTDKFGLITLAKSLTGMLSTIKTKILSITVSTILSVFHLGSIAQTTCQKKKDAINQEKTDTNKQKELKKTLLTGKQIIRKRQRKFMLITAKRMLIGRLPICQNGARKIQNLRVNTLKKMAEKVPLKDGEKTATVYNLQVSGTHEYFANNILVHNCMALAITLQAREQQDSNIVPDRIKPEGFYFMAELNAMEKVGKITRSDIREYEKTNHVIGMKKQFGTQPQGRRSRYVREK